ncbi:MAG: cytochrome-c oxidase, partial [Betaproteobacteria bacterium]|nr:cytochrome-c oxidase [Betaproteobacteria bacterium]
AVIMAVAVWWLLRHSFNVKPWVDERQLTDAPGVESLSLPTIKVGLGVFLAVATSLFALFISAYLMRRQGADWQPLAQPMVLWGNTALLVVGSVFFQRASNAAKAAQIDGVRNGLIAGGICTAAFLAGQLLAWQQLNAAGHYLTTNPANSFFYLLTAMHGLHLLGGLWVWSRTTFKVLRGASVGDVQMSVELCTIYWHFLLVVWLVLFGVLLFT